MTSTFAPTMLASAFKDETRYECTDAVQHNVTRAIHTRLLEEIKAPNVDFEMAVFNVKLEMLDVE